MSDAKTESLALLRSIDASLKALLLVMSQGRASSPDAPRVDLDSQHGNPKLRFLPRDWNGSGAFKGLLFSECPPDLLDMVADSLDYFASKAEDEKKKKYDTLDAARARGWAARLRGGWKPSAPKPITDENGDYVTDDFAAGAEPRW